MTLNSFESVLISNEIPVFWMYIEKLLPWILKIINTQNVIKKYIYQVDKLLDITGY